MKKGLLSLGIMAAVLLGFTSMTNAAVQMKATHKVKTEIKLKKPGDYFKSGKTKEQYISTGKISDFNQGPLKFTKAYYDVYRFTNLTQDAADSLPAPNNGSVPHKKVAYFLKFGATVTNTSSDQVHQNGFLADNYMTPTNEQIDLMGSMFTDSIIGDYNPNAVKKNKSVLLYLGSSNKNSDKIIEHGTYTFKSEDVLNKDDYIIANNLTIRVDPLSGQNITIDSIPTTVPHGSTD